MDCGLAWLWRWHCECFILATKTFYFTDGAVGRVSGIEAVFLYRTSWERSVEDAKHRNANS